MGLDALIQAVIGNQIATGLSAAAIMGGLIYWAREMPKQLWTLFLRTCTVELSVSNSDAAFEWIEAWLAQQPYAKVTRRVRLTTLDKNDNVEWLLSPGHGAHYFWWRGRLVVLQREISEGGQQGSMSKKKHESFHFRTLGRSQDVLRSLVTEAKSVTVDEDIVAIRVWRNSWWSPVRGKIPRPLHTVVLQSGQKQRIVADLTWYLGAREWYMQRGLPYRRGYLFDGPPGTGKTSMILALAGSFRRPVCVLNLGTLEDDNALISAVQDAPANAFIVLEDVDCASATQRREEKKAEGEKPAGKDSNSFEGISKAGLLNAIDGVATPDGRVFIMTTNHPDKLDPALVRPGRADMRESFVYLGPTEQQLLAKNFYGDAEFEPVSERCSPAVLQRIFMEHPQDPVAASETLRQEMKI